MPIKHLTRRTGGHLQKDPITGHLVKTCHTPGGGHPCVTACAVDPDPECCDTSDGLDPTPDSMNVTILSIVSCWCESNTVSLFHKFVLDGSGLAGVTFCLPYVDPCTYVATFDVTGLVKMLRCYNDHFFENCGGCEPDEDITVRALLTIGMGPGGAPNGDLFIEASDTAWTNPGDLRQASFGIASDIFSFVNCCSAWSGSGSAGACTGSPMRLTVTSVSGAPCCTP